MGRLSKQVKEKMMREEADPDGINKRNWKIFLKNNKVSAKDYDFWQYADDMFKERGKDPDNFNPRY